MKAYMNNSFNQKIHNISVNYIMWLYQIMLCYGHIPELTPKQFADILYVGLRLLYIK